MGQRNLELLWWVACCALPLVACQAEQNCSENCDGRGPEAGSGDGEVQDSPGADADGFPAELLPDEVAEGLDLVRPGPGGHAMFSDIVTVEPGQDVTHCTFTEVITEETLYVHDTIARQSAYGHHAILYYLPEPEAPGTRDCGDMEKFRQIIGGTAGSGDSAAKLPDNIVSEVPAGSQLVINHHWINYGEDPADVQAMVVTVPPEDEDDLLVARSLTIVGLGFEIAPGETEELEAECEFDRDVPAIMIFGHEHEWGTWFSAEHTRQDGSSEMILDYAYTPEMAANPDLFYFPVSDPLVFQKGDKLRMTCQWQNDTPDTITFPREMCVFFAYTLAEDDMNCVNGRWL